MNKRSKREFRNGFTLLELLVTIGIMAVIITLTVPAFRGMGRGQKMNTALSSLKTTFSLARQWAISHRDTVYVVFPDSSWSGDSSQEDNDRKKYNSYGVFSDNEGNYIKEWTYLPEGVVFDENQLNNLQSHTLEFEGSSDKTLKGIAFNQEGGLRKSVGKSTEIEIIEGFYDEETGSVQETFGSDTDQVNAVKVNEFTGLPYIERGPQNENGS